VKKILALERRLRASLSAYYARECPKLSSAEPLSAASAKHIDRIRVCGGTHFYSENFRLDF
jgi:hypothetical protein